MCHDAIIKIYNLKEVDDCINKLVKNDLRADFKQELFLILLQIPAEKIAQMNGGLKYFVVRVILNLVRQKRNIFHKTYLDKTVEYNTDKLNYQTTSPADKDTMSERIIREQKEDDIINRLDSIDKEMGNESWPYFKAAVVALSEHGSLREVSRKTGIPIVTFHRTIHKVRKHFRND